MKKEELRELIREELLTESLQGRIISMYQLWGKK